MESRKPEVLNAIDSCSNTESNMSDTESLRANMGNRFMISYAIYRGTATFTPHRGKALGVTSEDLKLYWEGFTEGWALARAANRTGVNLTHVVLFEFSGPRGTHEGVLRDSVIVTADEMSQEVQVVVSPGGPACSIWHNGRWTQGPGPSNNPDNRWFCVYVIECRESNPNGDPDNGGAPRVLANGHGYISYESTKRVIRDYSVNIAGVKLMNGRGTDLGALQAEYAAKGETQEEQQAAFQEALWDVRTFGGVHPSVGMKRSCGCVQMSGATSLEPVTVEEVTMTRVAGF